MKLVVQEQLDAVYEIRLVYFGRNVRGWSPFHYDPYINNNNSTTRT
jgi:hypothetical protein